jgi:hypothetical protein
MDSAVKYFEDTFTNVVTLNIDVGWGAMPYGGANGGSDPLPATALAASNVAYGSAGTGPNFGPNAVTLAQLTSALTSAGAAGANSLPNSAGGGRNLLVQPAEQIALGLLTNEGALIDGYVGFGAAPGRPDQWSYTSNVTSTTFDFIGTAQHEISEVMGRVSRVDAAGYYAPLDLFRFATSGLRLYTTATAPYNSAYFSIDGGATSLGRFNVNPRTISTTG